jgi:uncharacterized protein (DUF952 family)
MTLDSEHDIIFHVTTSRQWESQRKNSVYYPESYSVDGFIHCCTQKQLEGVLQRYFSGQKELVMLRLRAKSFGAALKYEPSTGNELFPHLYCGIRKAFIVDIESLQNG